MTRGWGHSLSPKRRKAVGLIAMYLQSQVVEPQMSVKSTPCKTQLKRIEEPRVILLNLRNITNINVKHTVKK